MSVVEGFQLRKRRDFELREFFPHLHPNFVMLVQRRIDTSVIAGSINGRQGRKKCLADPKTVLTRVRAGQSGRTTRSGHCLGLHDDKEESRRGKTAGENGAQVAFLPQCSPTNPGRPRPGNLVSR